MAIEGLIILDNTGYVPADRYIHVFRLRSVKPTHNPVRFQIDIHRIPPPSY